MLQFIAELSWGLILLVVLCGVTIQVQKRNQRAQNFDFLESGNPSQHVASDPKQKVDL